MKVLVDSSERLSGTVEEYEFKIWSEIKDVKSLDLVQAIIPKSVPNIIAGFNDTFSYEILGVKYDVTLTPGYYNAGPMTTPLKGGQTVVDGSLFHEIHRQMGLASGAPSVAALYLAFDMDPVTGNYSGFFSGKMTWNAVSIPQTITLLPNNPGDEGFWRMIGGQPDSTLIPNSGTVTMTGYLDMSYPRYLIMDVDVGNNFGQQWNTDGNSHSFVVPFAQANWSELENFTAANAYQQIDRTNDLNLLRFRIKFLPPDREANNGFTMSNVDHILVFEARQ